MDNNLNSSQHNSPATHNSKKKRGLTTIGIIIIILFVFSSCGLYKTNTDEKPLSSVEKEKISQQLIVTTYLEAYEPRARIIKIENTSEYNLELDFALNVYSQNNVLVGTLNPSNESAFESGSTIILGLYLDEDYYPEGPYHTDYEVSVKKETLFDCVLSDLSYESKTVDGKELISVTNNGDYAAEFVFGTVLFFEGDILVGTDYPHFTDDDSEIKPGETITEEVSSDYPYGSFEVYFTGYRK